MTAYFGNNLEHAVCDMAFLQPLTVLKMRTKASVIMILLSDLRRHSFTSLFFFLDFAFQLFNDLRECTMKQAQEFPRRMVSFWSYLV